MHGSAIVVADFIKMIWNQTEGGRQHSHADMRKIFSLDMRISASDF